MTIAWKIFVRKIRCRICIIFYCCKVISQEICDNLIVLLLSILNINFYLNRQRIKNLPGEFRNNVMKISTNFPKRFFRGYTSRYNSDQTNGGIGQTLISLRSLYNFVWNTIKTINKILGFIYAVKPTKSPDFTSQGLVETTIRA